MVIYTYRHEIMLTYGHRDQISQIYILVWHLMIHVFILVGKNFATIIGKATLVNYALFITDSSYGIFLGHHSTCSSELVRLEL